jgi:FkbM family methyltransferase
MFIDNLIPSFFGALSSPFCFIDRLRHPELISFGLYANLKKMHQKQIIEGIDSIWDVGANRGQFAFMAYKVWPELPIFSFEPDPVSYESLKETFSRFSIEGKTYHLALSDNSNPKELLRYADAVNNSLLKRHTEDPTSESVEVSCSKLDEIADINKFKAAFLKLDVQGYEASVLKGSEFFLSKCRYVQIEVAFSPAYSGAADIGEMLTLMKSYGFECIQILDLLRDKSKQNQILEMDLLFSRIGN